ncbi:MAG: alpha/beta hydrolase [Patescibacteria group bacterium]|nr:alpha/beta hydrolase [Patescibacteria group bacterium]
MQKRVFIFHGWDGYPEEGWFPWLRQELEAKGFVVTVPQLPMADEPRINNWVNEIKKLISDPDNKTYFVGHSMGCQAIARYLESLPEGTQVGGAVFVSGFFKRLTNLEDDDLTRDVAKEWLETPLDLNKVASHLKKSVAIFSDDDPYVSLDNQEQFANILNSKIIVEHGQGHFSGSNGITQLSVALEALLSLEE